MIGGWVAFGLVCLFIVSCPFLFAVFGKEDGCGRSWWDRFKASGKKK